MYAHRTNWNLKKNPLSLLLDKKKSAQIPILDLTQSNPTLVGLNYPENQILNAFQKYANLIYQPHPKGLISARNTIINYYQNYSIALNPEFIFLTSATSEAYSFIFKLMLEPGDIILLPRPGYPLLEILAGLQDIKIEYYDLIYDNNWRINFSSLPTDKNNKIKLLLWINPNNPAGAYLHRDEYYLLIDYCRENKIAIISDEVFSDYFYENNSNILPTLAGNNEILIFILNGISKMLGLPQMKLGWILLTGPEDIISESAMRLEMITDAYLSVGIPIQNALPDLMEHRIYIQTEINKRIRSNRDYLIQINARYKHISYLSASGGWYAIIQIPPAIDEEKLVIKLLDKENILVHPGYFYDFIQSGYLIVSLLPPSDLFQQGIEKIINSI